MWKTPLFLRQIVPVVTAVVPIYLNGVISAPTQENDSLRGFESCKVIAGDQARLECLKRLMPKPSTDTAAPEGGAWRLIRTSRPNGAADAVAMMRTADTTRSDPDLAGLMIRCRETPGLEVVLALVRPFPPRSKRDVIVDSGAAKTVFHAESSPPGTALVLPIDATAFTTGPFRELKLLSVKISDSESEIRGAIPLDGISAAIARLSTNCPSR
jgi:hypothetical protein